MIHNKKKLVYLSGAFKKENMKKGLFQILLFLLASCGYFVPLGERWGLVNEEPKTVETKPCHVNNSCPCPGTNLTCTPETVLELESKCQHYELGSEKVKYVCEIDQKMNLADRVEINIEIAHNPKKNGLNKVYTLEKNYEVFLYSKTHRNLIRILPYSENFSTDDKIFTFEFEYKTTEE